MIDTHFPELLYKDSPFLPTLSKADIEEIITTKQKQNTSLLSVICRQAGYVGELTNLLHEAHLIWIQQSFQCKAEDLVMYYIGFTTPIQLILSAIQMNHATTKTVIQNLGRPTNYKTMQDHNKYKISLLHDFYHLVSNKPEDKLNSIFNLSLSLLRQKPFNKNKYYQAGVEAGIYTLNTLFQKYQKHHPTTHI